MIKKTLLLIWPLIWFLTINVLFSNLSFRPYLYDTRFKNDVFPIRNHKYNYVVVGNSHARDSIHFSISINGINFGLSSQDLILNE